MVKFKYVSLKIFFYRLKDTITVRMTTWKYEME